MSLVTSDLLIHVTLNKINTSLCFVIYLYAFVLLTSTIVRLI